MPAKFSVHLEMYFEPGFGGCMVKAMPCAHALTTACFVQNKKTILPAIFLSFLACFFFGNNMLYFIQPMCLVSRNICIVVMMRIFKTLHSSRPATVRIRFFSLPVPAMSALTRLQRFRQKVPFCSQSALAGILELASKEASPANTKESRSGNLCSKGLPVCACMGRCW